jgi:hypothetical protein
MTISIKPTTSGSTIEQDGSTILTVDGSGNITPSNDLYPKVPAFSAWLSSDQTYSANTWTKVTMDTKRFDTTNDYDNTTNYRYTPSVAGYYQVTIGFYQNAGNRMVVGLRKNGSIEQHLHDGDFGGVGNYGPRGSALVYCNGTTDYLECYVYSSATTINNNIARNTFEAHLVSV